MDTHAKVISQRKIITHVPSNIGYNIKSHFSGS